MHPKIKNRPANEPSSIGTVQPLLSHDVINPTASANAASRHALVATPSASGIANHARHHVSRHSQA
jgi:hypothetical protein